MGSPELVVLIVIVLAVLVASMGVAIIWAFLRSTSAALSINDEWRAYQQFKLEQDRAEFMLREARDRDSRATPGRLPPLRDPNSPDLTTGPIV